MLVTNFISAMAAFSGLSNPLLSRQEACTAECAVALNATVSCGTSPDPYCGCTDLVPSAPNRPHPGPALESSRSAGTPGRVLGACVIPPIERGSSASVAVPLE